MGRIVSPRLRRPVLRGCAAPQALWQLAPTAAVLAKRRCSVSGRPASQG